MTVGSSLRAWFDLLRRRTDLGRDLPNPDLIFGVGHRTHAAMLAVRGARGGRAIVLMRPTLPLSFFDLAIVPEHDLRSREADRFMSAGSRSNVIVTRGVLNPIRPTRHPQPDRGLMLIGGPSRHVQWDDALMLAQVDAVLANDAHVQWDLTTSPRTPESMAKNLDELDRINLKVTPFAETAPGWVAERLDQSSRVWVSEDSVSMVYEALTAGAAVGVFDVAQRRINRVSEGLEKLIADGMVTNYSTWEQTRTLPAPRFRVNEADRCAEHILERWFAERMSASLSESATHEGAAQ